MPNRINYDREMQSILDELARRGERPPLVLHACCPPNTAAGRTSWPGSFPTRAI